MCYADKLIVMPEHATLAPPICRLAGEVLSIGRRVTQKGVVGKKTLLPSESPLLLSQDLNDFVWCSRYLTLDQSQKWRWPDEPRVLCEV